MALLVLWVLLSAFVGGSDAAWCVCRSESGQAALQKALDYACGAGADCGPILQNGPCFQPNTLISHCSYATNSYFQRRGQTGGTCDFSGTAMMTNADPSYTGCSYPSSASPGGTVPPTPPGSTTPTPPGSTTPTPGTPIIGTPTTFAPPGTFSPPGSTTFAPPGSTTFSPPGVLGGVGPGGNNMPTDGADLRLGAGVNWAAIAAALSGLVLLRAWR